MSSSKLGGSLRASVSGSGSKVGVRELALPLLPPELTLIPQTHTVPLQLIPPSPTQPSSRPLASRVCRSPEPGDDKSLDVIEHDDEEQRPDGDESHSHEVLAGPVAERAPLHSFCDRDLYLAAVQYVDRKGGQG